MSKITLKQLSLASVIALSAQALLAMDAPDQEAHTPPPIAEKQVLEETNIAYITTSTITAITPPNIAPQSASQKLMDITDITSLPQEMIELIFSNYCRGSFANISLTCQKFLQGIKNIEDIKSLPLPKELKEIVLNECQGSFNNVSLVCKDLLRLTNKLTTALNSKDNWAFKIFQHSPSISNHVMTCAGGSGSAIEGMVNNQAYLSSLISKNKIGLLNTKEIYPVFTKLFTRFQNLTSLDLDRVNLSNPTISQVSFFTENSLKQLTNLKFLHISPKFFGSPRNIDSEQPEATQNRLSTLREQLKELTKLRILICSGNILTDDILKCLPKLRNLDLSKNKLVTNEGLKNTSSLKYLCLGENQSISPQTLQSMTKLVFLDILYNKHYTNKDILSIPSLKILFANCSHLDIKNGFHNLKTLECHENSQSCRCVFSHYLLNIASNPIGDPYKTFTLKLEENR